MDGVAGVGAGLAGMHVGRGGKWRAGGGSLHGPWLPGPCRLVILIPYDEGKLLRRH